MTSRRLQMRAFVALLRLFPGAFRAEYGGEMEALFRSRLARTRGARATVRLWLRTLPDLLTTAIALRRAPHASPGRRETMSTFGRDVRHAARHLSRTPVFTLGAIALLAVGIGANTVVFTAADALLLRPPPFDRPEEVVYVYQDSDDGQPSSNSFPAFRDMAQSDAFAAVAATSSANVAWEREDGPVDAAIEFTTSAYLNVLGMNVRLGRWFLPEDDRVGSAPVAVVSEPTWRTRMGADPAVVGSTVRLNGQPVTIVGVGPDRLGGTYTPVVSDFWLSISATPVGGSFRVANLDRREDHWYDVRARLAPGVTVEQAQATMDGLARSLAEAFPDLNTGRDITVFRSTDVRVHPGADGALFSSAGVVTAIVLTLLLLACANLANLLLARGMGRSGEMAVRRALGAGTGSVVRLVLVEALLLSAAGSLLGVLLARWGLSALQALPLPYPLSATLDLRIDARVGVFVVALMALTGLLSGLAPAIRSARQSLAGALRAEQRGAPTGRGTVRLRNGLVAVQVGGSLVLVLAAGLLARSLAALQDLDTGIDAERVAWVRTSFGQAGLDGAGAAVALDETLVRLGALPGVTAAAAASRLPAQPSGTTTTLVEDYTPPSGTGAIELAFTSVTPAYFETVGLPLLQGRLLADSDGPGTDRVVVVNEAAARTFWGAADPIGKRLRSQSQPDLYRTVVGVVGDAPVSGLSDLSRPLFYAPMAQSGVGSAYLLVRTDGAPDGLLGVMRDEVRAVRSTLPVLAQGTLASHFDAAVAAPRLATRLMSAVSLLAMMLAGLGTYAVVAFGVARRSAELGIRMALGAGQGRVVRMVLRETAGTVLAGLASGVALALFAAPSLEPVLFGVAPLDPVTFVGAVLLLAVVSGVAAWVPARRAARADPLRSLRAS